MSVITVAEFASFMNENPAEDRLQEALDLAELLIASRIGALTLEKTADDTVDVTMVRNRATIEVRDGIIESVVKVEEDGVELDAAKYQPSYWLIGRTDGYTFNIGVKVIVTYDSGYATKADMPARLATACLVTAEAIWRNNVSDPNISSERIGDYAVTYALDKKEIGTPLPTSALALTHEFIRVIA